MRLAQLMSGQWGIPMRRWFQAIFLRLADRGEGGSNDDFVHSPGVDGARHQSEVAITKFGVMLLAFYACYASRVRSPRHEGGSFWDDTVEPRLASRRGRRRGTAEALPNLLAPTLCLHPAARTPVS